MLDTIEAVRAGSARLLPCTVCSSLHRPRAVLARMPEPRPPSMFRERDEPPLARLAAEGATAVRSGVASALVARGYGCCRTGRMDDKVNIAEKFARLEPGEPFVVPPSSSTARPPVRRGRLIDRTARDTDTRDAAGELTAEPVEL